VQLQSYRELLGRASNVGSLADVLAETAEGSMEAFVRRLELPLHRYRTTLVELRRALSLANEAETVNLDEGAAFAAWRSEAARTPGAEALRWRTLGQTFGFDALGDVHRKLCREAFQGEVSFGGRTVAVTTDSWRAQLNDESRELRTAVWDFVLARAAAVEPVLGRIKLSRLRFVSESARLRGFEDARTAAFAGFRVPVSVADTLRKLAPRTRSLADRYYRNKGKLLGISPLRDFDVVAPLAGIATDGLAFSRVIEVLRGELEERAPAYAQVLDEVLAGETLLSDPLASKSASWFVYADGNGGLPLVHVPYHRNLECYSAVAHELGHACHLTQLARTRGPIAQADDSLVLNEMFAIYFEIVALSGSLARAATSAERRFWRDALLEQGLHFMRTLPIWAHFEEGVHGGEAPEAAFRHATAALTPDWLSHGEVDQRWALQIHTEQMPFYGYGYQAAYAFALLMYLRCDATSLLRLATESPWQPLASVMGRLLNVELASQTAFDPVLGWLEGLLDQDQ
jgi:oligoendopeptidase F